MITGASLVLAFFACTSDVIGAGASVGSSIKEVKVVNDRWDAVYVRSAD